jgi:hypothetical protein
VPPETSLPGKAERREAMSEQVPYVQELEQKVDQLQQERDEAVSHREDYENVYIEQGSRLRQVREETVLLRALLRECHSAILDACGSEDGLDCAKGRPLLKRIEALFPDLKAYLGGPVL